MCGAKTSSRHLDVVAKICLQGAQSFVKRTLNQLPQGRKSDERIEWPPAEAEQTDIDIVSLVDVSCLAMVETRAS